MEWFSGFRHFSVENNLSSRKTQKPVGTKQCEQKIKLLSANQAAPVLPESMMSTLSLGDFSRMILGPFCRENCQEQAATATLLPHLSNTTALLLPRLLPHPGSITATLQLYYCHV